MEIDFSALASRVAAFSDVLGCIIVSGDGLVLGAFPPGDADGDRIKAAWLRFAAVGQPERGFLRIDGQVWAYVTRGSYAGFAVAEGATRPGVLLDHLEQNLAVAEEARMQRSVARPPDRVELLAGTRPKALADEPSSNGSHPKATPATEVTAPLERVAGPVEAPHPPVAAPEGEPAPPEDTEIDRVVLAREFAGLLQEENRDVERTGEDQSRGMPT
jgi:hypothetical protein